ncbi:fucolectin-like [Sardina pilchardus]|uniref:fucolectin-like n=1 Tax=Sardina pilchardus TaxID=27697 RepID=UPI002E143FF3
MEGRYVSIFIPGEGKQLALAEVQVFGKPAENLALGKEAKQSSFFSYDNRYSFAPMAVDGSRANSDFPLCSGTNGLDHPWWLVDLLEDYIVTTVTITSRDDCCEHLLINAEIHVSSSPEIDTYSNNSLCVVMEDGIPRGATNTYVCPDMTGRYVAVLQRGQGAYVFLCEVEVTGVPAVIPTPTPVPTTTTIPPPSPPPPLTLLVSGRTLVLVREQLSWYDALLHCRSFYRDLAGLRSPEEQLEVGEALLLRCSPASGTG